MSFDGPSDDPTTRPLPQGPAPSPYGDPRRPAAPSDADRTETLPSWASGPATQVFEGVATTPGGPAAPEGRPRRGRRGWRSPAFLWSAAIGTVLLLVAVGTVGYLKLRPVTASDAPEGTPTATGRAAGLPPGRTWLSGAWTGGGISVERIDAFGSWRGQPADVVTTYPAYDTWDQLRDTEWHIGTLDDFKGRLSYGLPLLPRDKSATLADVAAGKYDDVWTTVATLLNKHDRGDSFVRIGLEANGTWFPWGATAGSAEDFRAAWRHVRSVMKPISPGLSFGFDITCGKALEGGTDRMDNLTKLYPGDDVVDVVGCDHYDQWQLKSRNEAEWKRTLHPKAAAGLGDVADFARAHGKQLAIPEWGLASEAQDGAGDNPYFIYSMYGFFQDNKDILAYENYFNEANDSQGSAIWDSNQNPRAAAEYTKLWGAAPTLTSPSPAS